MKVNLSRRSFLQKSAIVTSGVVLGSPACSLSSKRADELFKISVAQWSINDLIFGDALKMGWQKFSEMLKNDFAGIEKQAPMKNIEFPAYARKLGIDGIEYVNTCMFNKAENKKYLASLKKACDDEGVQSLLIMCDMEGLVGHPKKEGRRQTLENHKKWIDAAASLGCHAIRVNAGSEGSYEEQKKFSADGLHMLCEYGDKQNIDILVENHGGNSSDAKWLVDVMKMTDHPRVGTLPDFGNFKISSNPDKWYDRYQGVEELMPFAKAVSAKSQRFNDKGEEIDTDYYKMIKIVLDAGYRGYIGIEYEGEQLDNKSGILATKKLLEKAREQYT